MKVIVQKQQGNLNNTVQHQSQLYESKKHQAQKQQEQKYKYGFSGKQKDRLANAALQYLKIGNFQQYCECMVELNEWEKALAFAPEVGMEYW